MVGKRIVVPRNRLAALFGTFDAPLLAFAGVLSRDIPALLGLVVLCWLELLAAPLGLLIALLLGNIPNRDVQHYIGAIWWMLFSLLPLALFWPAVADYFHDSTGAFVAAAGALCLSLWSYSRGHGMVEEAPFPDEATGCLVQVLVCAAVIATLVAGVVAIAMR